MPEKHTGLDRFDKNLGTDKQIKQKDGRGKLMAWIEFHPSTIKRLKKFSDFRKDVGWSVHEALGFLGDFWGQTVEVCEHGEITGWTPEYLSELTGLGPQVSGEVWESLVLRGWVDKLPEGRMLIHDWLDYAGSFLRSRYASGKREKLNEIWSRHGRIYGEPIGKQLESLPTLPNLTNLPTTFERFWKVYPKKKSKGQAEKAWKKIHPDKKLLEIILNAVERAMRSPDWLKEFGQFIPYPSTWLNAKGWEDELSGTQPPPDPNFNQNLKAKENELQAIKEKIWKARNKVMEATKR